MPRRQAAGDAWPETVGLTWQSWSAGPGF